jgi:hypothetical protein
MHRVLSNELLNEGVVHDSTKTQLVCSISSLTWNVVAVGVDYRGDRSGGPADTGLGEVGWRVIMRPWY